MKIRKGFVRIALARARRLDAAWLFRQAVKYLSIRRSLRRADGRVRSGPVIAHFFCTRKCNLKCPMCDIPGREAARELTTAESFALIDGLSELGVGGIAFTGGEPLLRPDIFDLLKRGSARGLSTILVTNGLLMDRALDGILGASPSVINVSLDGSTAGIHDKSRGKPGAFEKTLCNLQMLVKAVHDRKSPIQLVASAAISKNNIQDIGNIIALCKSLHIDRLILCPVHEFGRGRCRIAPLDLPYDLSAFLLNHPDRAMIDNSDQYLRALNSVFKGEPPPPGCCAGYTTLIIDFEGKVYPCKCYFETGRPLAETGPGKPRLGEIWHSEAFREFRLFCRTCRGCYLTLNREFDGLFA